MYLIDTNVISEARKGKSANKGVQNFLKEISANKDLVYISVITLGELRRGVEQIRHRGDARQSNKLDQWLDLVIGEYEGKILPFEQDEAQLWGRLRAPHPHNALDKQIAATALVHGLIVVTRNTRDFAPTGVKLLNPFE